MALKRGGLGRGLDALFVDNSAEEGGAVTLRLSEIEPNKLQPRKDFEPEALNELASSIAEHGILQPLLVRPLPDGGYQLVAGERRWRASRIAGLHEAPVLIKELSDEQTMEMALIENLQREDLNPIEEADGYRTLIEQYGLTQEEAAKKVGKSRPAVTNALRLLQLPDDILDKVKKGRISAGHGRAILGIEDDQERRRAAELAEEGVSVREIEKIAAQKASSPSGGDINGTANQKEKSPKIRDAIFDEVELALTELLGRKVTVITGGNKGTLSIEFYSQDDLIDLANVIGNDPETARQKQDSIFDKSENML